ncbi:hypothetical protein NC651_034869 [Populus alba x Populus x berolinensis]|nr:hypothetical protein NC651_034869 [Populus alba x Populus x berolinensis]
MLLINCGIHPEERAVLLPMELIVTRHHNKGVPQMDFQCSCHVPNTKANWSPASVGSHFSWAQKRQSEHFFSQVIKWSLSSFNHDRETFVHRSGRTGRAGKKGTAILIYTRDESRQVRIIERDTGCKFLELPNIAVDGESIDMYNDMGRGRFNSFGSPRGFGDGGRYGGQGNYGYGQGFRNSSSGRSDGQFSGSSRNGYNRNQSGNFEPL